MAPTALIVDDEPESARALARLLRMRGWSAVFASNELDARTMVRTEAPDAVVVDVVGPTRPGIDLARELADLAPNALVIATSGYSPSVLATIGVTVDPDHFLRKPFDPTVLDALFGSYIAPKNSTTDTARMAPISRRR